MRSFDRPENTENLTDDILTIIENGPRAITDVRLQLTGEYCSNIQRTWKVPSNTADFESLLVWLGFSVVNRIGNRGQIVGSNVTL